MSFKKIMGVILSLLIVFAYAPVGAHADNDTIIIGQFNFIDVHQDSWANAAITNMAKSGIINGYPDRTFKPDNPVAREEFALLISKTFYLDLPSKTQKPTFYDVDSERWSFPYIEAAKDFLTGYYPPSGHAFFNPEMEATREDVAVALVRTLGYTADDLENPDILDERFYDVEDISPNLRNYVALAVEKKLFNGYPDGSFAPNQPISRAEAATLLYKILKNATGDGQTELSLNVSVPETTTDGTVYVTGNVTKGATVTINNEKVDVVQGNFKAGYRIEEEGTYEIVVVARINGGKTKTITKQVTFERGGPELKIDSLPDSTESSTITVTGTVSDQSDDNAEVYLNDDLISNGWSNRFSYEVELQEGENTLIFKAVNSAGKTTTVTKNIMLNLGAPEFRFDYIPETTSNSNITLSGKVEDANDDSPKIYLNDELINYSWSNTFSRMVTLHDGKNNFTFVATNKNGKRATVTKTIILNSEGPRLMVHDLPENTTSRTVDVYWDVEDSNDSNPRIYVNDEYIAWSNNKRVTLQEGENTITVKAVNKLGKSTIVTKKITLSAGGPDLKIDPIPDTTASQSLTVSWTLQDANDSSPKLYIDDQPVANYYNNKSLTLHEGENKLVFKAINNLGKTTTIEKTVIFTPPAPELTIGEVPETTTQSTFKLTWTVQDENDNYPKVYVNDELIEYSTYKTVSLQDGTNTLVIKAVNSLGKATTITKTISKQ